MKEQDTLTSKNTQFSKYRGKLKDLYDDGRSLLNRAGVDSRLNRLNDIYTKDSQTVFKDILKNPDTAAEVSEAAYYASNPYASIIDYYKSFFYIRYTVVPNLLNQVKEKTNLIEDITNETGQNKDEYAKIYNRMTSCVEGLNLEVLFPSILEEALIKGRCGVVTEKFTSSEAILTTFLPSGYFKPIGKTQFGTKIIAFDYDYIDELKNTLMGASMDKVSDTDFESVFNSLPKILREGYELYLTDKNKYRWQTLDPKVATAFDFNELGIPPKLGAYPASSDYTNYKDIQLSKNVQSLDHILTHQIPTNNEGELILDVDEALAVAKEMKKSVSSIPNLKILTTFGKTDVHDLSSDKDEEITVLDGAYNAIYSSAGVDYHIFINGKTMEVSIRRDKAFIWNFLTQVNLFYNVTINNLINFKPYQCKINLLPISVQLEEKDIKQYLTNAGSGIGKLQAIVATGIKQVDLRSNYEVEQYLQLDEILKPLQSMYTSSYKAVENSTNKNRSTNAPQEGNSSVKDESVENLDDEDTEVDDK